MLVIKLMVLWVVVAIISLIAWRSAVVLSLSDPNSATGPAARQLRAAIRALVALPLLTIGVLAVVIFLVVQDDGFTRFAHGVFLLGLWLAAALCILGLAALARQRKLAPLSFLGLVLCLVVVIYLTPLTRFLIALAPVPMAWPLAAGAVLIAVSYVALFLLRQKLYLP